MRAAAGAPGRPSAHFARCALRCAGAFAALLLAAVPPAAAIERGRFELHGFGEMQLRSYAADYDPDTWLLSQWANVLNLELEADLAPDGWGPFDLITGFARVEVRYECVYWGCGTPSWRYWGDRANSAPRNYTDGITSPFTGILPRNDSRPVHRDNELVDFFLVPPFDRLRELGATNIDATFAPISEALFAVKRIDGVLGPAVFPLGPWNPQAKIDPDGSLETVPNRTLPLPLRPQVGPAGRTGSLEPHGLFVPSLAFRQRYEHFDDAEQNLSEADLMWNHGQGQDERELKELYLDIEMFDARLWLRLGKQTIVWGKTELFRTTDQFNPQDLALSSLPGLEESRLALWSARGVWSFYDVGPLEDLRLELAVNVDDFEPIDLGRCGEPYTVFLVCGKTFGLWAHGFSGAGVAGEERPSQFFHDPGEGIELGARVEFRYGRFSFQISDFWGYEDVPVIEAFNEYERRVDPLTGMPLDARGRPLVPGQPADEVLALHPGNRQLFDVVCSATVGIAGGFSSALADRCLVDLVNADANLGLNIDPPGAVSQVLGGSGGLGLTGEGIVFILTNLAGNPVNVDLIELNQDPNDGPGTPIPGLPTTAATALGSYLTDEQEGLLGCGRFYGTDCDRDGIDLFNAEASVLLQAFPQFEPGGAVATRPVRGLPSILPGARGPFDDIDRDGVADVIDPDVPVVLRYDPMRDGCVVPGPGACAGAHALIDPRTGEPFANEMAALSYNFMVLLAALGFATGNDPDCDPQDPISCQFVRGVFDIAGSRRPEVRAGGNGVYGRRDFFWHGGSELVVRYERRNVLGFAFDFAEDVTKTNWSVEMTWMEDQPFAVVDRRHGVSRHDTFNLTVSVDRPTFINFLNPNRTFFVNSQWFFRWIDDYRQGGFVAHGPLSVLGTLTVATGYHQDRLLPALTWVHDVRSTSGGLIGQVTYRFSPSFSATIGTAAFYGKPEPLPMALRQPLLTNASKPYEANVRYNGLIPIAERDEVFLLLRYTF